MKRMKKKRKKDRDRGIMEKRHEVGRVGKKNKIKKSYPNGKWKV